MIKLFAKASHVSRSLRLRISEDIDLIGAIIGHNFAFGFRRNHRLVSSQEIRQGESLLKKYENATCNSRTIGLFDPPGF